MCEGFGMIVDRTGQGYFIEPDLDGDISHSDILKRLGWVENTETVHRNFVRVECRDWTMATFKFDEESTLPGWVDEEAARNLVSKILDKAAPAWAEYEKVIAPALAEYEKVRAWAYAEYEKVSAPAYAEYEKVRAPALAEYKKVSDQALAEYKKVNDPAWAEYEKVWAWAEYEKVSAPAWAKYQKVRAQAWAEYEKVCKPALAEYEKVRAPAWAEYEKVSDQAEYYEKAKARAPANGILINKFSKLAEYLPSTSSAIGGR